MATMPKCSGPTLWTRGTSWPLGLSKTKVLRALACLGFRDRDMGNSFRVRGTIILNPKGRKGKKESFFLRLPPYHGLNGRFIDRTLWVILSPPRSRGCHQLPEARP